MAEDIFKKSVKQKADTYQAQEAAKHANMLRLRAERLARETANPPETKTVEAKAKTRKGKVRVFR
jgi:hypothetical protein